MKDDARPECTHWIGAERRHCKEVDGVRHYLPGMRCPAHTPNALQGKPETPPGPGWPSGAWSAPLSASALFDERAIASGRRRSSPHVYAAAKAAVAKKKEDQQ